MSMTEIEPLQALPYQIVIGSPFGDVPELTRDSRNKR